MVDERPTFPRQPLTYDGALLAFQQAAVDRLAEFTTGGMVAPCGAGKGEMLMALLAQLGLPTLIVVASLDQAEELRARCLARLGIAAGLIGGGIFDVRTITVALLQSLNETTLALIADRFGVLIVDEGHHAASPTYRAVSLAMRVRYRYWFSATPEREDGLTPFVFHHLGPVRHEVTRADLVAAGRAVEPRFAEVLTEFTYAYDDRADWSPMMKALAENEHRNDLVADMVSLHGGGHVSAVLTGRVDHAETLRGMLEERGLRAFTLTGSTKKAERTRIIDAARAGELDVIVGTQLLDEGIDIALLSRLFLVFPAKAEGRLVQRVGRALRVADGKPEPIVFDFVDGKVGVLANQARVRRGVFARQWPTSRMRRAA